MSIYKEYIEEGVEFSALQTGMMPLKEFQLAHQGLTLFCHDIFVEYQGGILLVIRDNEPARDVLWPLGGRVMRGMDVMESARRKVKEESDLDLTVTRIMGMCRTYFRTDPFRHGHGTDSVNAVLYGKGEGKLKLDHLHLIPSIIKPADCTEEFMKGLPQYVRDYLEVAMKMAFGKIE
jgi:ADP-ribose pyrophosphatase YjhB (NUDIX family)